MAGLEPPKRLNEEDRLNRDFGPGLNELSTETINQAKALLQAVDIFFISECADVEMVGMLNAFVVLRDEAGFDTALKFFKGFMLGRSMERTTAQRWDNLLLSTARQVVSEGEEISNAVAGQVRSVTEKVVT